MIIEAFNLIYFSLLILTICLTILLTYLFKDKSEKAKKTLIVSMGVFDVVFFIIYKIWLSVDLETFNIWNELPFQLCNINMFLIPIGVLLNNKPLKAFGFYVAPLAALMAITFPEHDFHGNSILLFRNIGFYGTHLIIIIMGILICSLGFLKPKLSNIKSLLIGTVILSLGAFLLNLLLFALTNVETNYFFTMNTADISILNLFYNLIPIKYLYLLPSMVILIVYVLIINGGQKLLEIIKNKAEE